MRSTFAAMLILAGLFLQSARADEPVTAAAKEPAPVTAAGPPRIPDRLDLDTTSIRGNQELPKVLYILPWQEPGAAGPSGRPLNSLIDEALAPVDREVFRRQQLYFDQLYGGAESKPDITP
jgi:hypothetical protein